MSTPANPSGLVVTDVGTVGLGGRPGYGLELRNVLNSSAGKPGGGSWSNSSDRRLKENIEDLDPVLDRLLSMRPVSFDWINPHIHGNKKTELVL